jgi:hypothetical protein
MTTINLIAFRDIDGIATSHLKLLNTKKTIENTHENSASGTQIC